MRTPLYRHVVYFAQGGTSTHGGDWLREATGWVEAPAIQDTVFGDARIRRMNLWATRVFAPASGEVCLDVTDVDTGDDYQVGDFVWARFDAVGRRVVWPEPHVFLQFTPDGRAKAVARSARPVYSTTDTLVYDVTGTVFAPVAQSVLGLRLSLDRLALAPMRHPCEEEGALIVRRDRVRVHADLPRRVAVATGA